MNNMQNAIVCNTPFQILGAINIVCNKLFDAEFDLYLDGAFRDADSVYKQLCDCNVFKNIYYWEKKRNRRKSRLRSFFKLINNYVLLKDFNFTDNSFKNKRYQKVFVGDGNLIGIYLTSCNKNAELIIYDDGIATNVGNALFDTIGKFYSFFGGILKLGVFRYNVQKLLVNNVDFCQSNISPNKEQLPTLNLENKAFDIAKRVFSYNFDSLLREKTLVYLGQPLAEKQGYNGRPGLFFLDYFPEFKNNLIVRAHPRQSLEEFNGCEIDKVNNMWELECITSITNSHILFSFCSTAQIMPKLLCDKEPYIVFLFKLFIDSYDTNEYKNDMLIYESIKSVYRDKEKIFLPENIEDLKHFINKVTK